MIAAASVAAALHGLSWTSKSGCSLSQLLQRLHQITAIEQVILKYQNSTVTYSHKTVYFKIYPCPSDYVTNLFESDQQKRNLEKILCLTKKIILE